MNNRIGYWVIIALLISWSIYLEVRNRELSYAAQYIKGSNDHLEKALIQCHQNMSVLIQNKTTD